MFFFFQGGAPGRERVKSWLTFKSHFTLVLLVEGSRQGQSIGDHIVMSQGLGLTTWW